MHRHFAVLCAALVSAAALSHAPASAFAQAPPAYAGGPADAPGWSLAAVQATCAKVCAPPARWSGQAWPSARGRITLCACETLSPQFPAPPPGPVASPPGAALVTIYEHPGFKGVTAQLKVGRYDIHETTPPLCSDA